MIGWKRASRAGGLALAWTLLATACGGGTEKSPKSASDSDLPLEGPSRDRQSMSASSEIGALDEAAVTATFSDALGSLRACLDDGARRIEFIGGEIAFFIKIDQSGQVAHVHAERSTIGDRDTERCMLGVLRSRDWPRPQGGDTGLARNSFEFDMPNDVRPPTPWDSDQVSEALGELSTDISECKSRARGEFIATMYVDTEGNALGVGIAPSDESGEEAADCLAGVLKAAQYPSPGSWPAKVTFAL